MGGGGQGNCHFPFCKHTQKVGYWVSPVRLPAEQGGITGALVYFGFLASKYPVSRGILQFQPWTWIILTRTHLVLLSTSNVPWAVLCLPRFWPPQNVVLTASSSHTPHPPCISFALVQATVGAGTILLWDLILLRYQTQCSHRRHGFGDEFAIHIESLTHLL